MTAEELYIEGVKKMQHFYNTAPYGGCGGVHSTDYKKMVVENYFIPAAEKGCIQAMKECGDYYSSIDTSKAIKFYKLYLNNCPGDTITKTALIARFGFRLLI